MYRPRKPSTHLKQKKQAVEQYAQARLYPLCVSVGHSPFLISWSAFHTTTPTSQHRPLSQLSFVFVVLLILSLTPSLPQFLLAAWGCYTRAAGSTCLRNQAHAPWRLPDCGSRVFAPPPEQSPRMSEPGCCLPRWTRASYPTLVCPAQFSPGHLGARIGEPLGPRNRP